MARKKEIKLFNIWKINPKTDTAKLLDYTPIGQRDAVRYAKEMKLKYPRGHFWVGRLVKVVA